MTSTSHSASVLFPSPSSSTLTLPEPLPPPSETLPWSSPKTHLSAAVDAAVWWWGDFLKKSSTLSLEQIKKFENSLREQVIGKITDHWYPDMPSKGQAYRSLSIDKKAHIDPILLRAASIVGIENFSTYFSKLDSVLMWIDPDVVVVRVTFVGYVNIPPEDKVLYRSSLTANTKSSPKSFNQRDSKTPAMVIAQPVPQNRTGLLRGGSGSNGVINHLPVRPPSPNQTYIGSYRSSSPGLTATASQYIPTIHYGHPASQFSTIHKAPPYLPQQRAASSILYSSPFTQSQYLHTWNNHGQFSETWNDSNSTNQSPPPNSQPPQQNNSQRSKNVYIDYMDSALPLEAQA
jgi:hypothetical protein